MAKHIHLHLPKNFKDTAGALRTVARGSPTVRIANDRMPKARKAKDMSKADFAELEGLLKKFFGEESSEAEHQQDCTCRQHRDAETKHDPKNGQFTSGGGSSAAKKESSHKEHPLPDTSAGGTVFDIPSEDGPLHTKVERRADGSYYGSNKNFDFSAPNAEAMREKLKKWKAKYVGAEHK